MDFFVYRRSALPKAGPLHLQERSLGDERSYSPVDLNEFFRLKASVFAKPTQLHLQERRSRAKRSYAPRLHITRHIQKWRSRAERNYAPVYLIESFRKNTSVLTKETFRHERLTH